MRLVSLGRFGCALCVSLFAFQAWAGDGHTDSATQSVSQLRADCRKSCRGMDAEAIPACESACQTWQPVVGEGERVAVRASENAEANRAVR